MFFNCLLQSLWDTLPLELQDYIIVMASKGDRLEKSLKNFNLRQEVKTYHKIKSQWRLIRTYTMQFFKMQFKVL